MIAADGVSSTNIRVSVFENELIPKITGGDTVTLTTTAGNLSAVTDNGDGTYTAVLTSSVTEETAVVSGMLNGNSIVVTANVSFEVARLSAFTTTLPLNEPFDSTVTSYTANVTNAVDYFTVTPGIAPGIQVKLMRKAVNGITDEWGYTLKENEESDGITIYHEGPNVFTFTVEGAFHRSTEYTVSINRQQSAKLTGMTTTGTFFPFDPNTVNYSKTTFDRITTFTPTFEAGAVVEVSVMGAAFLPISSGSNVPISLTGGGTEDIVQFRVNENGKAAKLYTYRIIGVFGD